MGRKNIQYMYEGKKYSTTGETLADAVENAIPIPDSLFYRLVQCPNKQGFVIGGGSEPITESTYDRAWERIAGKIELYGATAHILRHTYATSPFMKGFFHDITTGMEWQGL